MTAKLVTRWLLERVGRKLAGFGVHSEVEQCQVDLFESQVLDSMALMDLLLTAEIEFGFRFTTESFLDDRIRTIHGISQIITEIQNNHGQ